MRLAKIPINDEYASFLMHYSMGMLDLKASLSRLLEVYSLVVVLDLATLDLCNEFACLATIFCIQKDARVGLLLNGEVNQVLLTCRRADSMVLPNDVSVEGLI